MIGVTRGACPQSLVKNKSKWDRELAAAKQSRDKVRIRNAESKYAQLDVKMALETSFNEKCAYCESEINSVSFSHIEHFRPKSKFDTSCFEWSNLLLACSRCNSKAHKGDHFPEVKDGGPLIDPSAEDPNQHMTFVYDRGTKLALANPTTVRGTTTVSLFGLNVRKALLKRRSNFVRKLLALKAVCGNDPEALALLASAKAANAEYSAWALALT